MTKNAVDNAIMEAVFEDDHTTGTLKTKNTFVVATGMWRLYEDDTISYILYTLMITQMTVYGLLF